MATKNTKKPSKKTASKTVKKTTTVKKTKNSTVKKVVKTTKATKPTNKKQEVDQDKRDFMVLAATATAGVGAACAAAPLIGSMMPADDVLALSSTEYVAR